MNLPQHRLCDCLYVGVKKPRPYAWKNGDLTPKLVLATINILHQFKENEPKNVMVISKYGVTIEEIDPLNLLKRKIINI